MRSPGRTNRSGKRLDASVQSEMLVQKREVGCCGCESHQQQGCPFLDFFRKLGRVVTAFIWWTVVKS